MLVPTVHAQCTNPCSGNLLRNPDFELNTAVCTTINNGQLYIDQSPVQDWFGTAGVNSSQNGITPDNYNSGCMGNSTLNCGSGVGSLGVFTFVGGEGREYVQSELLAPLEAGADYCFTLQIRGGPSSQPNNGMGVWFTDQMVNISTMNNGASFLGPGSLINATPYWQLAPGDLISACTQRTATFCATGNESWIVLGNFRNNANTSIQSGGFITTGYLIIDNLSLTKVCAADPLSIEASALQIACNGSVTLQAVGGGGTYTWSPDIGTGAGPFTVSPTVATTYTVSSSYQGTCGPLTATAEVTIGVDPCAHTVTASAGETCQGGCVELFATITNALVPPYTFVWDNGVSNGPGPHTVCPLETTTYTVTVTDANGEEVTAQATVVVFDDPEQTATSTGTSCPGVADGTATVIATGGTEPFAHVWDTSPPQSGATATGLLPGTYSVTTTDANGCASTTPVTVGGPVGAVQAAFTAAPPVITEPGTPVEFSNISQGATSYAWDFGGYGSSVEVDPTFTFPVEDGEVLVCLVATSAIGCSDTACVLLRFGEYSPIDVPNVFSPNGDGTNDGFGVIGDPGPLSDFSLLVFNRWGQLLFSTGRIDQFWDGRIGSGDRVPDGTYFWVLDYTPMAGGRVERTGTVTLLN